MDKSNQMYSKTCNDVYNLVFYDFSLPFWQIQHLYIILAHLYLVMANNIAPQQASWFNLNYHDHLNHVHAIHR